MSASRFDGFHDCVEDDAEDGVVNTHQCSTNSTKSDRSDGSSQTSLSDCHLLLRSARQGSFDDVQVRTALHKMRRLTIGLYCSGFKKSLSLLRSNAHVLCVVRRYLRLPSRNHIHALKDVL